MNLIYYGLNVKMIKLLKSYIQYILYQFHFSLPKSSKQIYSHLFN